MVIKGQFANTGDIPLKEGLHKLQKLDIDNWDEWKEE